MEVKPARAGFDPLTVQSLMHRSDYLFLPVTVGLEWLTSRVLGSLPCFTASGFGGWKINDRIHLLLAKFYRGAGRITTGATDRGFGRRLIRQYVMPVGKVSSMSLKNVNPAIANIVVISLLAGLVTLFFIGAAYAALGLMALLGFGAILALLVISIRSRERK